jgi:hypothetical protein
MGGQNINDGIYITGVQAYELNRAITNDEWMGVEVVDASRDTGFGRVTIAR